MRMPGGFILPDGAVQASVRFRDITGRLELAVATALSHARSEMEFADALVEAFCATPLDQGARSLTPADRLFLLARIAGSLAVAPIWQSVHCEDCGEAFDLPIDPAALPVKPAMASYPFAEVRIGADTLRFRVPTIGDLADLPDEDVNAAGRTLIARLALKALPTDLTDDDLARIDAALQDASPEIAETALTTCPSCDARNEVRIDLVQLVLRALSDPLDDVHRIASVYHWPEDAILDLPRGRRHAYLARIDREAVGAR